MHIELGWHRDKDGGVVFDEVSLCHGPDPDGLTDLREDLAQEIMNPPVRFLSMGCVVHDKKCSGGHE